jgi:methylthioribose-1-phosphate isomerase
MIVAGKHFQSLWPDPGNPGIFRIIDQHKLPFEFSIREISSSRQAHEAIRTMMVRGAPLIGVTAAFGMSLACLEAAEKKNWRKTIAVSAALFRSARPTAVNLYTAVERVMQAIQDAEDPGESYRLARQEAVRLMEEEIKSSFRIGENGLVIIQELSRRKKGGTVNILTHCNAGWLACIDYGTATAPVYLAHDRGIPVHVWVDETRPRNQGARLTAWEFGQHGVPHTVVVDNAGGHLMQKGMVDLVLVGSDRTTLKGDVANKIGTYLKALSAYDNNIPFYAALPSSSIDFEQGTGVKDIPIEQRSSSEVREIEGIKDGKIQSVTILPENSPVANYGFDVTPARLVTGLITERGICAANEKAILELFPEKRI